MKLRGKVRTIECPLCGMTLQWLVTAGELRGLKDHVQYLHPTVEWLTVVKQVQS